MVQKNIKLKQGFTIIELLVVIVVIGILAAITIVSYTGVTKKANATAAESLKSSIVDMATMYFSNEGKGYYPADVSALTDAANVAQKPSGATIIAKSKKYTLSTTTWADQTSNPTSTNGTTTISYIAKSNKEGACITYYDYTNSVEKTVFLGTATSGVAFTAPGGTLVDAQIAPYTCT